MSFWLQSRSRTYIMSFLILVAVAILAGQRVYSSSLSSSVLRLDRSVSDSSFRAGASTVERKLGFVTVTGSIANNTVKPLTDVETVVELLDPQNETVGVEVGLISFDPLSPGETSPYRVDLSDSPRAVAYRVRFRKLSGAEVK